MSIPIDFLNKINIKFIPQYTMHPHFQISLYPSSPIAITVFLRDPYAPVVTASTLLPSPPPHPPPLPHRTRPRRAPVPGRLCKHCAWHISRSRGGPGRGVLRPSVKQCRCWCCRLDKGVGMPRKVRGPVKIQSHLEQNLTLLLHRSM